MSEKKQSSVEWLFEKLSNTPQNKFDWYSLLQQAKEMHQEEIIKASTSGYCAASDGNLDEDEAIDYGEQYYNETFNK